MGRDKGGALHNGHGGPLAYTQNKKLVALSRT